VAAGHKLEPKLGMQQVTKGITGEIQQGSCTRLFCIRTTGQLEIPDGDLDKCGPYPESSGSPAEESGMLATTAATPSPTPGRSSASRRVSRRLYAAVSRPAAVRLWQPLTARLLQVLTQTSLGRNEWLRAAPGQLQMTTL